MTDTLTAHIPSRKRKMRNALAMALAAAVIGAMLGGSGLGPFSSNPILSAAFGAGALFLVTTVFVTLMDWRQGLALLLVIVLAEDTLRKSVPTAPNWINLGKDFVVAAAYLSFMFRPRTRGTVRLPRRANMLIVAPLGAWAAFVIFECFNPGVSHMLIAISGVRTWLLYMPVLVLAAHYIQEIERPERVFNFIVALAIPFFVLTMLQNAFGEQLPDFMFDRHLMTYRTIESGESIRYNESVFATPTIYALVCVLHVCLVVGLLKMRQSPRWVAVLWVCSYCAVAGAYLSGIRTGLLFIGCAVLGLVPLMFMRKRITPSGAIEKRRGLLVGAMVGLMIGGALVASMKETRANVFWSSLDPGIVGERMHFAVEGTSYFETGAIGKGTGTAGKSGAVLALVGEEGGGFIHVEWGSGLVKYCFGDIGLWLGAGLLAWLLAGLLRFATEYRNSRYMPLRYALWIYVCAQMGWFLFKAYPVLENGTMTLMFWSSVGFILGLHEIDRREAESSGLFA